MKVNRSNERLHFSSSRLYIDLNEGRRGDEDGLNIRGFKANSIFFITNKVKVPLQEVCPFKRDYYDPTRFNAKRPRLIIIFLLKRRGRHLHKNWVLKISFVLIVMANLWSFCFHRNWKRMIWVILIWTFKDNYSEDVANVTCNFNCKCISDIEYLFF